MTAMSYSKAARVETRQRLLNAKAGDEQRLADMHAIVSAELSQIDNLPLPTPSPVPPRFSNADVGTCLSQC